MNMGLPSHLKTNNLGLQTSSLFYSILILILFYTHPYCICLTFVFFIHYIICFFFALLCFGMWAQQTQLHVETLEQNQNKQHLFFCLPCIEPIKLFFYLPKLPPILFQIKNKKTHFSRQLQLALLPFSFCNIPPTIVFLDTPLGV